MPCPPAILTGTIDDVAIIDEIKTSNIEGKIISLIGLKNLGVKIVGVAYKGQNEYGSGDGTCSCGGSCSVWIRCHF